MSRADRAGLVVAFVVLWVTVVWSVASLNSHAERLEQVVCADTEVVLVEARLALDSLEPTERMRAERRVDEALGRLSAVFELDCNLDFGGE